MANPFQNKKGECNNSPFLFYFFKIKEVFMKHNKPGIIGRYLTVWTMTVFGFFMALFLAHNAPAANFDIKPIKIFLDPKSKIEKLTLKNINEDDLTVQIKGYQWTQNEKGQDIYQETKDLILFPRITTIKKEEEKIIRIGTNLHSGSKEKTYRIFVEEIPSGEKIESTGSTIHMYMKIGVPVFISPAKKEEKGMIEAVNIQKGKAEIKVQNNGNLHFMVNAVQLQGVDSQGKEIFSTAVDGWYILCGESKAYEITIPQDKCKNIIRLNIEVKTNNNNIFKELVPVEKPMCGRPI
jgi:fimbrial chaperone protein